MIVLVLVLLWICVMAFVAYMAGEPKRAKREDLTLGRIDRAKQDALDDIRRRRQQAEDQLRRLQRWSR